MAKPYATTPLVVDTSAWIRQRDPAVRPRWEATLRAGLLASCPVVALELLAAARDELEFTALAAALDALPQAPVTTSACRLPAADYLIAAAAAERGFGVLHEDRHFDTLAGVLGFSSVRITR